MTRLKVHHLVNDGGLQQQTVDDKLGIHVSSVERILREPEPTPEEVASNVRHGRRGRPSLVDAFRDRVVGLLTETPGLPGVEVIRLARGWGYTGKRSALYELITAVRPPPKQEPVILFDGARGEFAQFDFGETWVKFGNGQRLKVIFFAGRLKWSRYVRVVVTPNQQAETLIRSLLICLVAFGGAPKEWVFDNPKTVRISRIGEDIVLHRKPPVNRMVSAKSGAEWPHTWSPPCRPTPSPLPTLLTSPFAGPAPMHSACFGPWTPAA